ncbi:MFS transporter [Pseudonocardia xinjiangensis]|uniref:MHS family MFS transporter n=1 Tax=Pseudonocardia xinjiangensis TaxID=75289 RepID=A0ABX1RCM0_9PSEU|nr:MFS transporter [Pseudonocardia xinjiangensis]NMH78117.1 MHS family MFS transporter [Pseudonocardia xinjiangensis]
MSSSTEYPPDAPAPAATPAEVRRVAVASLVGTSIEWYDFFIYGLAAVIVFRGQFFPGASPLAGTLAALGTFAVGFLARPIGGVVFGHLGDRIGRKRTLVTTLVSMGVATALIGVLPNFAQIGVAAPILLVLLRVVQGLAVGGEWGGAVLISVEHAPENRRGLYGSFPQLGVPIGLITSNLVFLVLAATLSDEQFTSWGWRIPFLVSAALVAVGLYVRLKVTESPEFVAAAAAAKAAPSMRLPIITVARDHWPQVLCGIGIFAGITTMGYMAATFAIQYGTATLGLPNTFMISAVLVAALLEIPLSLYFSSLSDRIGRHRMILFGAVSTGLVAIVFLPLLATAVPVVVFIAVVLGRTGAAPMYGPSAAVAAEAFPVEVRYSGASIGYQLGSVLGGALAPIIATLLLASAAGVWGVSVYLTFMVVLAGIGTVVAGRLQARTAAVPAA